MRRPTLPRIAAGHTTRRIALPLSLLVAVLAVVSLVLLSPVALAALNPNGSADWPRLADISQTYAAASAVLAILALVGVAISLIFQAREMRLARAQAMRGIHIDLMKMAMEDPVYMRCWGPFASSEDQVHRREIMYVNMIIAFWNMAYENSDLSEIPLRAGAAELFQGEPGQRFWRAARKDRLEAATRRRSRRFHQIIDEEYQKATQPPPASEPAPAPVEPEPEAPESSDQEEPEQESPELPPDGE